MTLDPVKPDYDGAWVGAIVPALLAGAQASWLPEPVRAARSVVLLVLDGLGWNAVQAQRDELPQLGAMVGSAITTVAPSTTSAALTSIATGLPPARHGITGYRLRVGGTVLNVLGWFAEGGQPPEAERVQPHRPFEGRPVPVVTRAEFSGTGFTKAHLRGSRFVGWRTTSSLVEHCRRLVVGGESLVYAYYDGIDKIAHAHGLQDEFFSAEVLAADRLVGELLSVLDADTALLVTADHGQVHVPPDGREPLGAVAGLVGAYSGEGRFRSLYARPGTSGELLAAARELYGDRAWVLSRDELFDEGWLGEGASAEVRGRVGDVVLAARTAVAFMDPGQPFEGMLVSHHGSLTADEMYVPLLAARGEARDGLRGEGQTESVRS